MKVVGVIVALTTLASLLVGTALPTSAAAPGALAWTTTSTPSNDGNVMIADAAAGTDFIVAAADGKTVFAYNDTAKSIRKSTNGGVTFGAAVVIVFATATPVVAVKISPNYATDSAIAIADADEVWLSVNGGSTYNSVILDLAAKLEVGGTITSMDMANFYTGPLSILLGVTGGAGLISNVLMWSSGAFSWAAVGTMTALGAGLDPDGVGARVAFDPSVVGVAFSPSHATDAEIMAVFGEPDPDGAGVETARTVLTSRFGALDWNAFIPAVVVAAAGAATNASIATGSDYVANTGAPILVGLNGSGVDDIYRITGRSAAAGISADLNVSGAPSLTSIRQIAVSGPSATAAVLFTVPASSAVRRATGVSTFTVGGVSKQPTTAGAATVAWGGTTAFVGTIGVNSAVSRSIDSGVSFDQTALIDVGVVADMTLVNMTVVDANTLFLVMNNADSGVAGYSARSIYKSTDAGASWVRILTGAATAEVLVSPAYATDSSIVLIDGTTIVQKSTNGGATFVPFAVPVGAAKGVMVDGTNFFVGGAAAAQFFKSGRFTGATGLTAMTVFSVALDPKDATKATIVVGTTTGEVFKSTNDGVSFTQVGTTDISATGGNVIVAVGPDGTVYAADAGALTGAFRWTGTAWLNITATTGASTGLAVSADGTLYLAEAGAGIGVLRTLKPLAAGTAADPFDVQVLNYAAAAWGAATTAADITLISAAAANSIYVIEPTVATSGTAAFVGRIRGFSDSLIVAAKNATPADKAIIASTTTAAVTWTAITGVTAYQVYRGGVSLNANYATAGTTLGDGLDGAGAAVAADTALVPGASYTWNVRAVTPLFSRPSVATTLTTSLAAVNPQPVAVNPAPMLGSQDVAIDATFFWPAVAGATGYEFTIAEDIDPAEPNKFAIIDYSATTATNAFAGRENLKYDTTYYWRVVPFNATGAKGAASVFFFTTEPKPAPVVVDTTPPVIIEQQAPPQITLTIPPAEVTKVEPIPTYLLWAVIAVGAVLIIAVIVLIVRTRRIS